LRGFDGRWFPKLIAGENRRGLSVESSLQVVSLRPEIDARDVLHPDKRPVRIRPDDDVTEFLRRLQSTLRSHGVSELLSTRNRFASDLPGGIDVVLLLHCGDDVRHSDAKLRELIRLYPKPHCIMAGAENEHFQFPAGAVS